MNNGKHLVKVTQDFRSETQLGALMIDGEEVAPPKVNTIDYVEGQVVEFKTKGAALAWVGLRPDHTEYMGEISDAPKT